MESNPCWKLLVTVLLLLELFGTATVGQEERKTQPHIIFILADDVGWGDVSWHNAKVLTPNMEELAKKGVILEQSYVLPRCTPTRAALLTGRHPYTYGRQSRVIKALEPAGVPLRFKLLPETLKEAGYSTHAVGKWHLGFCSKAYTPTQRGFDSFYGFHSGSQDYFKHTFPYNVPSCPERRCKRKATKIGLDLYNNTAPDKSKNGIYSTHLFTSHVEDLLHNRDAKKPLFLYIAYQSAHAPLQVPTEYLAPFRSIKDKKRRTKLGMLLALDEAVGRVAKALKTSGHYENSVIIFSTDNGPPSRQGGSNWPLCGKKGSLLEGTTRGVAFVHSPLLEKPYVSEKLIHVTDWYSTLTSLATGRTLLNTDGFDQWRAISTPSVPSPRRKMVYNINFVNEFQAAVREDSFKLLIGASNNKRYWIHPSENVDENEHKMKDKTRSDETWNQNDKIQANLTKTNERTMKPNLVKRDVKYTMKNNERIDNKKKERGEERNIVEKANDWVTFAELGLNIKKYPLLRQHITKKTGVVLFNVKDDEGERHNIAKTNVKEVKKLLKFLERKMKHYVAAKILPSNERGHPKYWHSVWSPGWCQARR